jgi:hypothetical protein
MRGRLVLGEIEHLRLVEMVQCHIETARPKMDPSANSSHLWAIRGSVARTSRSAVFRAASRHSAAAALKRSSPVLMTLLDPAQRTCSRTNGSKLLARI